MVSEDSKVRVLKAILFPADGVTGKVPVTHHFLTEFSVPPTRDKNMRPFYLKMEVGGVTDKTQAPVVMGPSSPIWSFA